MTSMAMLNNRRVHASQVFYWLNHHHVKMGIIRPVLKPVVMVLGIPHWKNPLIFVVVVVVVVHPKFRHLLTCEKENMQVQRLKVSCASARRLQQFEKHWILSWKKMVAIQSRDSTWYHPNDDCT